MPADVGVNMNLRRQEALPVADQHNSSGAPVLDKVIEEINTAVDTGEKLSLAALMMVVMVERAEILEGQLREEVEEIQGDNAELKNANNIMAKSRNAKKDASEDDKTAMPAEVSNFLKKHNIPWTTKDDNDNTPGKLNSTQWDLAIENIKGWSESKNSGSQLKMTQVQSLSGKNNQTFDTLSQFITKGFRSSDGIIKNF